MDKEKKKNNIVVRYLVGLMMVMLLMLGLAGCKKKEQATTEGLSIVTTETVTEAASEKKTEAKSEAKSESKTEAKSESKKEEKTEAKSEAKSESGKEDRSEAKSESKKEEKTEARSEKDAEDISVDDTEEVTEDVTDESTESSDVDEAEIDEDGYYYSKDEVALYIHIYGKLPGNFITKKEAKKLGWSGGSLEDYAPGKVIGGDRFGNREGVLPDYGEYHECDIDTLGKKKRGAKRIVFSDDGRIYYTEDHYETFELLYGEER